MPAIGDTLGGRYRIDALLGSGGMATVYRGRDLRLERDVAIKVLLPAQARDPAVAERFDREARAMAAVRHPAIVSIHDVEPADPPSRPEPFFVMELCEGGSLADRIARTSVIPPDDLIPMMIAVAGGLAELHGRGVVHRDVKPHNILLASDGARLGDLGVAQDSAVDADALTSTGATVGTLAYLAPEVMAGEAATPESDVYSLAVSTYQGLTGRLPRPAANLADLVETRSSPITPPSVVAPALGDAFDAVLQAAMAPAPADRPDALELAAALTSSLGRWARDRSRGIVAPVEASVPADDAPTLVDVPTVVAVPTPGPPTAAEPTVAAPVVHRRRPSLAAIVAGIALAIGAVALLVVLLGMFGGSLGDRFGGGPGASGGDVPPSPSAAPSAQVPASASAAPAPGSSQPQPDALAAARAAVREVEAAIAAAKGGRDGLKGKEAKDLETRVAAVERALDDGNVRDAARRADELVKHVQDLVRRRAVSGADADRLLAATHALRDAIPAG